MDSHKKTIGKYKVL